MKNVATVGSRFHGWCQSCEDYVDGVMVEGEFVTINGKNVCVVGSLGVGSCGHTTHVVKGSNVLSIHNKPIARVGDHVSGVINGEITTGEFVLTD